jgi:hypothetical protein
MGRRVCLFLKVGRSKFFFSQGIIVLVVWDGTVKERGRVYIYIFTFSFHNMVI